MSAAAGGQPEEFALRAGWAESTDGPVIGETASRPARVQHGQSPRQGRCASRRDRPAAGPGRRASEATRASRRGGGADAATRGRVDRLTSTEREISVDTITKHNTIPEPSDGLLDLTELVCPGCWDPVVDGPPPGWPARAGRAPDFSHPDGSVLCPDEYGRIGEPIEADGLRYGLTDTGATASLDEARWSQ
ncbi:hypothetical protein [Pseudonocardia ammonioxydans]|uniref:hypothetical protein n=1 Tax=Pseudonocardia ammonioxydans TaxID=260086 RepID=UPI0011608B69|nr:hypothetical protein [Pseudonocardia ammonioxydans]